MVIFQATTVATAEVPHLFLPAGGKIRECQHLSLKCTAAVQTAKCLQSHVVI